jgi:hypothetical protein
VIALALALLAAPVVNEKALLHGALPDDPAKAIVEGKCMLCHSAEYVTQQRLTQAQWQKTVEKMRKFGSPLTDDDVKLVVDYLARHWTPSLPPPQPVRAPAPPGSTP